MDQLDPIVPGEDRRVQNIIGANGVSAHLFNLAAFQKPLVDQKLPPIIFNKEMTLYFAVFETCKVDSSFTSYLQITGCRASRQLPFHGAAMRNSLFRVVSRIISTQMPSFIQIQRYRLWLRATTFVAYSHTDESGQWVVGSVQLEGYVPSLPTAHYPLFPNASNC
jgi:hypothetical protein